MSHQPPPARNATPASPGDAATAVLDAPEYAPQPRPGLLPRRPMARRTVWYLLLACLVGALAGLVWHMVVELPVYTITTDGQLGAVTTERGLTAVFATDAWFSALGGVVGLLAGLLGWVWFKRLGWPVVLLAMVASLVAALVCWWVGTSLGPNHFEARLRQAPAGSELPIDFRMRSWPALVVWPFAATIPILLWSSFGRDEHLTPAGAQARGASSD